MVLEEAETPALADDAEHRIRVIDADAGETVNLKAPEGLGEQRGGRPEYRHLPATRGQPQQIVDRVVDATWLSGSSRSLLSAGSAPGLAA